MLATSDRLPDVVQTLLRDGADPSAKHLHCITALMHQGTTLTALMVAENTPHAFSWSLAVCPKIVHLLKQSLRWKPQSHHIFPPRFRRGVRHVYGLKVHLEQQQELPMLPTVVWWMIVAELPRSWGLGS